MRGGGLVTVIRWFGWGLGGGDVYILRARDRGGGLDLWKKKENEKEQDNDGMGK